MSDYPIVNEIVFHPYFIPIIKLVAACFFILVPILFTGRAIRYDRARINEYIKVYDGRLLSVKWRPIEGLIRGHIHDRLYNVKYMNFQGNIIAALCLTGYYTGVFFSEREINQYALQEEPAFSATTNGSPTSQSHESTRLTHEYQTNRTLWSENKRLRKEIIDRKNGPLTEVEQVMYENHELRMENQQLREKLGEE